MKNNKITLVIAMILLTCFFKPVHAVDLTQNFNFDGYLVDSSNNPLSGSQSLKFQIYDPSVSCLLFEETQTVTITSTDGSFSTKVGAGTRASAAVDGGVVFKTIFQNNSQVRTAGTNCASGYTPAANDGRKLRVTVNGTVLSPDYSLSAVPMATVAESLQGKVPSDFIAAKPYNLPGADGSANQVIQTDGAGNLSWVTPSAGGITSLNGSSSASQSFSVGTTGLLPAFSTAGSVHTLNIPLASGAGVTSGTISKTDYDNFNNKMSASGATMTGALLLSADPTVALQAATKQYVDSAVSGSGPGAGTTVNNMLRWNGSTWVETSGLQVDGTGYVLVSNSPTSSSHAATKAYVDTAVGGISSGEINTASSLGGTASVFSNKTGVDLQFRGITQGPGIAVTQNSTDIVIGLAGGAISDGNVADVGVDKVSSSAGKYFTYAPNGTACASNDVMRWNGTQWICGGAPIDRGGDLMTGTFGIAPGTASFPGLYVSGDTDTGITHTAADNFDIVTAGIVRMKVDGSGNVGIGNNAPTAKLDVNGSINANGPLYVNGSMKVGATGSNVNSIENFLSVSCNAGATVSASSSIQCNTSISAANTDALNCRPSTGILPTGLIMDCFPNGGIVTIRLYNATAAPITTGIPTTWNITAIRF